MLCEDIFRAEKYTVQRHDSRQLVTTAGVVNFTHTLFKSREDGSHHYLLDEWMGLDAHERLSEEAETAVVTEAINTSYAHAARVLGEDARISKTAVMNKVHALREELPFQQPEKKKSVEYLYIEADEDHIHRQEKQQSEKKGCMLGKLLYLYEGQETKDHRRELKNVFYLGGLYAGGEAKGQLWKALYQGKKFRKTMKRIRRSAPNEKAVDDCREYLLNNWESAVRRLQDKNVYGCSARDM